MKIGIDFGTSFSLPATVYAGNPITLLPGGKYGIPSVFYYGEGEILIGEEAEAAGLGDQAQNLKREIKMELQQPFYADGRTFTPKEIVGSIINYVIDVGVQTANTKLIDEDLEGVVISVPAAFTHNEKEYIRDAVEENCKGVRVLGLIKEPVAAALAYFQASLKDHTKVLVYDLGGGTCDVAIVEANKNVDGKYKVLESDMRRVGGKDWDSKLAVYITHELCKQTGLSLNSVEYQEKIKRAANSAKHDFSKKRIGGGYKDRVVARVEINGRMQSVTITRGMFDEMTMGLFYETLRMTKSVIQKSGYNDIDKIVCVGGGSNMPQVIEGLTNAFGDKVQVFEPEKAIAYGAAIYAEACGIGGVASGKKLVQDIAAFSYGIKTHDGYDYSNEYILNLIQKNVSLPFVSHHVFTPMENNQRYVTFSVYESSIEKERCMVEEVPDEFILSVDLKLPPNTPRTASIDVDMSLTNDGLLEIKARDQNGNRCEAKKQLNF